MVHRVMAGLRACGASSIRIAGYASSAPYRSKSDARNLALAGRRVERVAVAAQREGLSAERLPWDHIEDMRRVDFFLDQRDGRRLLEAEALNRRVDVRYACSAPAVAPSHTGGP